MKLKRTLIGFWIGLSLFSLPIMYMVGSELFYYDGTCGPKLLHLDRSCSRTEYLLTYTSYFLPEVSKKIWFELAFLFVVPLAFGFLIDKRLGTPEEPPKP